MWYYVLFLLQYQITVFWSTIRQSDDVRRLFLLFSLCIFYLFTVGIRETADWENYLFVFQDSSYETKDFLIRYISDVVASLGGDYSIVFIIHILLIGLLYCLFAYRNSNHVFLVVTIYLALNYVPVVNQIRFFLAFSLYLWSLYFFYVNRRLKWSIFLGIFSLLSHSAIVLLFLVLLIPKTSYNRYLKALLYCSIPVASVVYFAFTLGLGSDIRGVGLYLTSSMLSSFQGGAFQCIPFITILASLYFFSQRVVKSNPLILLDNKFTFLRNLSFFPIVFIPGSFMLQIIGDRYVFSYLIVWVCFFTLHLKYLNRRSQILVVLTGFYVIYIFTLSWLYILPQFVLGESSRFDELIRSFTSIEYFNNLYDK